MTYEEKAWGMYLFSAGSLHSTLSLCVGCFITLLEEIIHKVFKKVFFRGFFVDFADFGTISTCSE